LAGNPLLLTMIAMIAKHQELPRDRAKLYDNATRVLCHQWDATRHQLRYEHKTVSLELNEEDKLTLLRQLAWQMQSSSKGLAGNFITGEELETTVVQYLEGERFKLSRPDALSFGRAVIAQLRERNFILCLYGANVYGFVHRTFLEYFCAADQVHRFEKTQELSIDQLKETFKQQSGDETWHEVLRLICGMIDPKFACELVETLLLKEIRDWKRYDNLEFAQSCLDEIATSAARESTSQRLFEAWKQFATDSQENEWVRRTAVEALVRFYKNDPDVYAWLQQFLPGVSSSFQRTAVFGWEIIGWEIRGDLRTGKEIDNARVQQAATALNLPEEIIRRCYEQLAEEYEFFGFKLSWVTEMR